MTDDKLMEELKERLMLVANLSKSFDQRAAIIAMFDAERELTKKLMFWANKHVHDCEPKMFDQREPQQHCDDPDCAPCGVLCAIDTIEKARGK